MKGIRSFRATFIIAASLLVAAIPAFAQADPTKKSGDTVEQTLTKLDRDLMDAVVRKDKAFNDHVLLDNHVFINPGGGVDVRGENPRPGPMIDSIDIEKVRVWIHGDTAVLTGRAQVKGRFEKGADISGLYRYMRVFVKQQGQWRTAATSTFRIPQPASKPSEVTKPN